MKIFDWHTGYEKLDDVLEETNTPFLKNKNHLLHYLFGGHEIKDSEETSYTTFIAFYFDNECSLLLPACEDVIIDNMIKGYKNGKI